MQIGLAVKFTRESRGLSGKDLSNKSCVSAATISQLETGKHKDIALSNALAISRALEISPDELVALAIIHQHKGAPPG